MDKITNIETNIFDECIIYTDCIVEVWRNSVTGETSVGWRRTENTEEIKE